MKTSKVDKKELLKNHETQVLLDKLLSNEIKELTPIYDAKLGYRYPQVEAIVGGGQDARAFLERLSEEEILEKKLYDKIIYCPKCKTANVSVHYCCPYCKSFNMQRSSLVEHVKCGYMDVEENFRKGIRLVCPKCHEELKRPDVDHRKAGVWCSCNDCSKSFDIPVSSHFCRDCHKNFSFEDIVIRNIYSYTLNEETREEAAFGRVLITPILKFLAEQGFDVESPAYLKGKSGANHKFDIVASKGEANRKITVIDIATRSDDSVSEQPVIALFAKTFDVSPNKAYLVAIPYMNENGRKMAELYNIQIIEAKNEKEAIGNLEASIKS